MLWTVRLDRWESDRNEWTATLPVLQHFESLFKCDPATAAECVIDECDNVAVKKRKIDANNKNYIIAGMLRDIIPWQITGLFSRFYTHWLFFLFLKYFLFVHVDCFQ